MSLSFFYSLLLLIGIAPLFRLSVNPSRPGIARYAAWAFMHVSYLAFYFYAGSRMFSRLSDQHIQYTIAGFGGVAYLLLAAYHLKIVKGARNEDGA
jgi:hypothetical protein